MFSFLLLSRQSYTVPFTLLGQREQDGKGGGSIVGGGQTTDGVLDPSHQGLDLTRCQGTTMPPPLIELAVKVPDDVAVLYIHPQHKWNRRDVDVVEGNQARRAACPVHVEGHRPSTGIKDTSDVMPTFRSQRGPPVQNVVAEIVSVGRRRPSGDGCR